MHNICPLVKYKTSFFQEKGCNRRIFRMPLHLLELSDVILTNGIVVQIPTFVADACNRILEQVETEGIFRKAGSSIRQKEIRVSYFSQSEPCSNHSTNNIGNTRVRNAAW